MTPSIPTAPTAAFDSLLFPEQPLQATGELPLRRAARAAEQQTSRVAGRRKPAQARGDRPARAQRAVAQRPERPIVDRPARAPRAVAGPRRSTSPRTAPRSKRGLFAQFVSLSAMAGVFALLVSTSLPANAFYTAEDAAAVALATDATAAASVNAVQPQEVRVNAKAATVAAETATIPRDSYEAKSFQQQITSLQGNPNFNYTNNPSGTIQWPFPVTVPITSGFGPRAVCSYCSSYHLGVDFTPGAGVPIQAIADGVVSEVNVQGGGFGNNVMVDHVINGQRVQSLYAHMQWGSIQVAVGQQIPVGTTIGAVGSTGNSTGPHLHLEIHLDGTAVDPYVWLKANAN